MMFWYGGQWAFWEVALMWIGMIVFWGLLIWGVYALISNATRRARSDDRGGDRGGYLSRDQEGGYQGGGHQEGGRDGDARRILDERLARGEIDAEEYRRLRDLMTSDAARPTVGSDTGS